MWHSLFLIRKDSLKCIVIIKIVELFLNFLSSSFSVYHFSDNLYDYASSLAYLRHFLSFASKITEKDLSLVYSLIFAMLDWYLMALNIGSEISEECALRALSILRSDTIHITDKDVKYFSHYFIKSFFDENWILALSKFLIVSNNTNF